MGHTIEMPSNTEDQIENHQENEIKFTVSDEAQAKMLAALFDRGRIDEIIHWIGAIFDFSDYTVTPENIEIITDEYFDTEDLEIHEIHGSLRVRHLNEQLTLTLKKLIGQEPGQLKRQELSQPITNSGYNKFVDDGVNIVIQANLPDLVGKKFVRMLKVGNERKSFLARREDETYRLSFDLFEFLNPKTQETSEKRFEIEIEALNEISSERLGDIKRNLKNVLPDFHYSKGSKYEQGTSWIKDREGREKTPSNERTPKSKTHEPIKILFLAANPKDTQRLRLDEELRSIEQALQRTAFREGFDIKQHWAVRIAELQNYLLRHKPDIVHFSGHGSPSNELILEDLSGKSRAVPAKALGRLFSVLKDNIRCVVLNACYSELQAQEIAKSIDCVIGMSKQIDDKSAIGFASAFYQALGFGRDVQTAFNLGLIQIDLQDLDEKDAPQLIAARCNPGEVFFIQEQV